MSLMRGCCRREEGTEAARVEEMRRVTWKFLEAKWLHSSMHGKRWPCPKKGSMQISSDILFCFEGCYCCCGVSELMGVFIIGRFEAQEKA